MLDQAHTIIYVEDVQRCAAFYHDILGMAVQPIGNDRVQVKLNGASLLLVARTQAHSDGSRPVHLAFDVHDLEQEYRELSEKHVVFSSPPAVTLFGKTATICDPDGTPIDLIQWSRREGETVSSQTVVNDILAHSPEAMQVLEAHGIRICGGCIVLLNGTIQETAEYSGLSSGESSDLVRELSDQVRLSALIPHSS